jgi:hypothetical protein
MSRLSFSPREFALLAIVLQRLSAFLHVPNRDAAEFEAFAREMYPFLHALDFDVVRSRFSDEEVEKISIWDEHDRPVAEEVEFYARLIAIWQEDAKD